MTAPISVKGESYQKKVNAYKIEKDENARGRGFQPAPYWYRGGRWRCEFGCTSEG